LSSATPTASRRFEPDGWTRVGEATAVDQSKRNEQPGSLGHWLRNVKTKNAAHAPHHVLGPALTRRTRTGTRGLRYFGAAALRKQRVALVRITEGKGIHLHAD
jgi:hypothetical protein